MPISGFLRPSITQNTFIKDNQNDYFVDKQCPLSHFRLLFDENKYYIEEHAITTKDGYLLIVFRIRLNYTNQLSEENKKNINQPIVLMHGLEVDSDAWFLNEIDKSLGHHLVDLGYDVWAPNNRGNKYSRSHINKNITKDQFYDFSFQEMGLYDVPAIYDSIFSKYEDQSKKIIYIGESQGATEFFVAGTEETTREYIRSKTSKFIAFDPVVYCTGINNSTFKWLASHLKIIYKYLGFLMNDKE